MIPLTLTCIIMWWWGPMWMDHEYRVWSCAECSDRIRDVRTLYGNGIGACIKEKALK